MLIKIRKSEVDAMQYAAALVELRVRFYTVESPVTEKPETMCVEVTNSECEDPSPLMTWYLARHFDIKLEVDQFVNRKP
jgi:hypothetical protein